MSGDNIQRQIEFILQQQARFDEGMHQLRDALLSLANIVEAQSNQIARHDEQIARHDAQIAALIEHGKETDSRLDRLIAVVERHISGHNGIK